MLDLHDLVLHPPINAIIGVVLDENAISEALNSLIYDVVVASLIIWSKLLRQRIGCLLGVVMGQPGEEMVAHMSVLDVMKESIKEPSEAAIDGGKLATKPCPVLVGVVWEVLL
jgi:hypothetical protein